jgi:RNA polymerase sigma factor (sigma-70 family)
MPSGSPTELVRACKRGDADAWDQLLDSYGRLIWSVAQRLGARSDEAEEIFQRVWVAVVEGIDELRDPRRLASWVAGVARFQTYRLFSEQGRQRRLASLDEIESDGNEPSSASDVEDELGRLEEEAALRDALQMIDQRCRQLLHLLFFCNPPPSYEEISRLTGLAVGSIGPIRARCLARLRRAFDHPGVYQNRSRPDP